MCGLCSHCGGAWSAQQCLLSCGHSSLCAAVKGCGGAFSGPPTTAAGCDTPSAALCIHTVTYKTSVGKLAHLAKRGEGAQQLPFPTSAQQWQSRQGQHNPVVEWNSVYLHIHQASATAEVNVVRMASVRLPSRPLGGARPAYLTWTLLSAAGCSAAVESVPAAAYR